MSIKAVEKKLNILTKEVVNLRSLLLSMAIEKDSEGEYNPKFIRDVAKASKQKGDYAFTNSKDFLKLLRLSK